MVLLHTAGGDKTHIFTTLQAALITTPTLLLGVYYFVRSRRLGPLMMLIFLTGIVYGISVEMLDIRTTETYFYTDLLLMLGRDPNWVPFSVGVSWACLMFVMMTTSDRLGAPAMLRPLLDGTLAMCVDLVMDPVASASVRVTAIKDSCAFTPAVEFGGRGMWTWCVPQDAPALWFTVPISNFVGWFLVVSCFSAAVRIVRGPLRGAARPWPVQLGLLLAAAAVAGLLVLSAAWVYPRVLSTGVRQWSVFALMLVGPLAGLVVSRTRLNRSNPRDLGLLALPLVILVSETVTFFRRGIDSPHWPGSALLLVACALLSAALLWLPYSGRASADTASSRAASDRRSA